MRIESRNWNVLAAALMLSVALASLVPQVGPSLAVEGGDKILHLLVYGFLGVWAAFNPHGWRILQLIMGLAAYGFVLELLQKLTSHRHFELLDILANTAGAAVGVFGGQMLRQMLRRVAT